MKNLLYVVLSVIVLAGFSSCGSRDRSKEIGSYKYEEDKAPMNDILQKKVGSWIKEGMSCYGIAILQDENGLPKKMIELECSVVSIEKDKIKVKALEEVHLAPVAGCSKIGVKKGETWDEIDGDLFKTREDAQSFIDTNYPGLRLLKK